MSVKRTTHRVSRRSVMINVGLSAMMFSLPRAGTAKAASDVGQTGGDGKMIVGMVVFDGFELLDVFGPLEMFGSLRDQVKIVMLAEQPGQVASSAGPTVVVDASLAATPRLDVLMIPGGIGTRREVDNKSLIDAVRALA